MSITRTSVRSQKTCHNATLSTEDVYHLEATYGRKGSVQLVFSTLLTKFVNELRKHSIGPQYDAAEFERAVEQCSLTIPRGKRSAVKKPNPKGFV